MIKPDLTNYYYNHVECDCCFRLLPENPKIAFTRSKKVKAGFWCVACALDKHVITDRQVIRFLKKKQDKPRFRNQKREPFRY